MAPSTKSPLDDVNSPYFLHPSDGPGLQLVTTLLDEDNYIAWSRAMTISLTVKSKMGFVNGKITCPNEDDATTHNAWQKNNGMVLSWILNSVSPPIRESVMFTDSASELWMDLKTRFSQSNKPRVFQLRQSLANLKQDQSSVSVYFTRLKTIWDELSNYRPACVCGACTCGAPQKLSTHHNEEHAMAFLMGLNDSLAHVRGQILLMDPLPSISKVFALVSQEEKQKALMAMSTDTGSLVFAARDQDQKTSNTNTGTYQNPGSGMYQGYNKKAKGFCTYCKIFGHIAEKCFKLHGFPPGWKQRPRNFGTQESYTKHPVQLVGNTVSNVSTAPSMTSFTPDQCQQMLTFLSSQMAKQTSATTAKDNSTVACVSGQVMEEDWQG